MSTTAFSRIGSLLETPDLPSLGPDVRTGRAPVASLEQKLDAVFSENKVPSPAQALIRSLVLLWHDHLDESHAISQGITSADGSFLHGIMHRREPDYGNAKYWFHRVGNHASYPVIAVRAAALLEKSKPIGPVENLIHEGAWDPFAFIDACEAALAKRDEKSVLILQRIQEVEFHALLEHFLR